MDILPIYFLCSTPHFLTLKPRALYGALRMDDDISQKVAGKPSWLKTKIPQGRRYKEVRRAVSRGHLNTVCVEAHCPNIGECWEAGQATFMILGDRCTRGCRFCAVERGRSGGQRDDGEPMRVAEAARQMSLDYVVVTSVTRDDLDDGGASVFAATVREVKSLAPPPLVELLIPDYVGDELSIVIDSAPDVLAHNIEVVERLTDSLRHEKFSYRRSLSVLEAIRRRNAKMLTKSSLMLGLGETDEEVLEAMRDLRSVDVKILVLGQYLRPTRAHAEVVEYSPPARFERLAQTASKLGFDFVSASPLARTSYRAAEAYARRVLVTSRSQSVK